MDKPRGRKDELPVVHKPTRDIDLHCTEEVCTSTEFDQGDDISPRPYSIPIQRSSEIYPHLRLRSRSPEQLRFSFPSLGSQQWKNAVRDAYKHLKPEDTENNIRESHNSNTTNTQPSHNMDTTPERQSTSKNIRDKEPNSSNRSTPRSGKEHTTTCTTGQCDSPVALQSNSNPNTHNQQKRKKSNSTTEATTTTKKRTRTDEHQEGTSDTETQESPIEETTTTGRGRGGSITTSSRGNGSNNNQYYTFILHKANFAQNWKQRTAHRNTQAPSFLSFDHGDHIHIIFPCAESGTNGARTRNRITTYLGASSSGIAESVVTTQIIKNLRNYLLYCIRYGVNTANIHGSRQKEKLNYIQGLYNQLLKSYSGTTIIDGKCKLYIEQKKEDKEKRTGKNKTKHLSDIIYEKVIEQDIQSYQDWDNKLDPQFKLYLIREFGLTVDSYITKIIRITKTSKLQKLKQQSMVEIYKDILEIAQEDITTTAFQSILDWIKYLFKENRIDIINYFAWNECIKTHRYMKVNAIVLQGYTNAGKSLLIDTMITPICPEEIPRERDNSSFHLDQLPGASGVLFEEPMITPVNVGTWKLLLEGKTIKTDVKHKDKEGIKRVAVWITTASDITTNIDENEKIQVEQRIKKFIFSKSISHRTEKSTLNNTIRNKRIEAPPGFIKPIHFAVLYAQLAEEIKEEINKIDKDLTINQDHLPIEETTWQQLKEKLTQLQTSTPEQRKSRVPLKTITLMPLDLQEEETTEDSDDQCTP